jgi:hypothetical protein
MLNKADLNIILDAIENDKCILLLGPEVNNISDGLSNEKALFDYLISQGVKLHFYEKDGLFLFDENTSLAAVTYHIKQFYINSPIPQIYDKIAKIPFNLLISLTPDLFLKKTFDKFKFDCNISIYNKLGNAEKIDTPNKETPLLYYLFGSFDKPNTLILTHDDLFNFILAILNKNELPIELKNLIQDAEYLIFLGFRFDHWYMQILMRLLSSQVKQSFARLTIDKYALSEGTDKETKAFYFNEFKIEFINDSIPQFINQLYQECEQRKKLRIAGSNEDNITKKVDECILNGDIDTAFKYLRKILEKDIPESINIDLNNQIRLLSGQYEFLKKQQIKQIISIDNYNIERNRILDSISTVLNDIKNLQRLS